MPVEKSKEDRRDAIINRLAQIEAAFSDLHLTESGLRKERTALWVEYK